jgi:OCT family organic cation transporter-like MFS transporter 4/5
LKIVCHTKKIFSLVGTVYFVASLAGYLALSKFPDRYGRKTVFITLNVFSLIATVQMFFLFNYGQILVTSFVLGLSSLNMAISSVIVNENIDGKYTAFIIGLAMAMFPVGGLINTFFMYFIGNWQYYFFMNIILLIIVNFLCFKYVKESPKWLLANNRIKEYFETILYIAELNGNLERTKNLIQEHQPKIKKKSFSFDRGSVYVQGNDYRHHIYDIYDLFKYQSIRTYTFANMYLWIVSGFSFYGILLNLEGLTGNIYIDSIVSYSAEFFAEIGSGIAADKYGRKFTVFWSFVLASIGCCFFPFFESYIISLPLLFISCIGIASAFNVMYIYSAELYPTNIKSLAVSVFFVFNRVAAGTVPFILTLINNVVLFIFVLSVGGFLVVTLLPETLKREVSDEIEEIKTLMIKESSREERLSNSNIYFEDVFSVDSY